MKDWRLTVSVFLIGAAAVVLAGCVVPRAQSATATPNVASQQQSAAGSAATAVMGPQPAATLQPTATPAVSASGRVAQKGKEAPDFTLLDLDGNAVKLSNLKGSVVLLNFFATWCPPCNAELPDLIRLHEEYAEDGLVILAVNQAESVKTVVDFVEANEVPFPVVLDSSGLVSRQYTVRAIPRSLFIDADGVIVVDHLGYMKDEEMRGYLNQVLE